MAADNVHVMWSPHSDPRNGLERHAGRGVLVGPGLAPAICCGGIRDHTHAAGKGGIFRLVSEIASLLHRQRLIAKEYKLKALDSFWDTLGGKTKDLTDKVK